MTIITAICIIILLFIGCILIWINNSDLGRIELQDSIKPVEFDCSSEDYEEMQSDVQVKQKEQNQEL